MNLETSRVEQNEQVKAVDFDFAFESIASNIALAIRRIVGQTESDILIGGVVTAAPGSSMNIIISEILASGLNSFALDTEQIGPIGVSASTTADRRDIVQVRGVYEGYDSKQRGFYDTDTDIVTYAFIDTKKKLAVEVSVKAGVPGSVSAPTTDEGYIKIAEILIPAGSINITDGNIFNVTADISGVENNYWKTEKSRSFRVGGINDIKTLFRVQHEASGAHKDNVIGANSIKIGNAQNFLNGSIIPNGASALIGSENLPATTTIPNMIASVLAYINTEIADRKKLSEITTQVSSDMTLGSFEKNTRRYLFNPSENNITISMKSGEKIKEEASFVLLSKELAGMEKISETDWVFLSRNLVDASTVLGKIPGTRGLDYLQSGTVAQMAAKVLSDLKTVDGSGSGLDADLLDGAQRTVFMERQNQYVSDFNAISTSMLGIGETITFVSSYQPANRPSQGHNYYTGFISCQIADSGGYLTVLAFGSTGLDDFWFRRLTAGVWGSWVKIWNAGNDGSGSGLDADTVDGSHYNANDILTKLKTVDGSGSGLDADLLDGAHRSAFMEKSQIVISDFNDITDSTLEIGETITFVTGFQPGNNPPTANYFSGLISKQLTGFITVIAFSAFGSVYPFIRQMSGGVWGSWAFVWNSLNDGSGSGLDADTVDGSHYNANDILTKLKTVDGPGSGLDADTATKLATARKINGVDFDGTADVYVDGVPIGTIIATVSDTPDNGYAFCHGQALSRLTYSILFSKIGIKYGVGNGTTTFNLPDCREVSLVGAGANALNAAQIKSHNTLTAGQFQDDQMQGHYHKILSSAKDLGKGTGGSGLHFTTHHYGNARDPITDGKNGTPRTGETTHGKQLGVNYQIKISN